MRSGRRLWFGLWGCAALLVLSASSTAQTRSEAELSNPGRDSTAFRLEGGYHHKRVYGVPMHMGEVGLHFGFAATKLKPLVIYPGLHQSIGRTEHGLAVWETSIRGLLDFPVGRLHLGVEPQIALLGVRRTSEAGTMHDLSMGGHLLLGLDVLGDADSALQLSMRGGCNLMVDENDQTEPAWSYAISAAYVTW